VQIRRNERGQILVLFALGLVAMIAMVGLILDGGSAFAQRRTEQNAADLASLAAATVQINQTVANDPAVIAEAKKVAKANGFDDADPNVDVTVKLSGNSTPGDPSDDCSPAPCSVQVDIDAPHPNAFAGVVGMSTWDVSATATAIGGVPVGAMGAAPIAFSDTAFDANGDVMPGYGCPVQPCTPVGFGNGNGDVPQNATDISWTNYGTDNIDSGNCTQQDRVSCYLSGLQLLAPTFQVGDYIGQMNNGVHTDTFGDGTTPNSTDCAAGGSKTTVESCYAGKDVVVPIVSPAGSGLCTDNTHNGGCFRGWALFHVVGATKHGNVSTVDGYFVSGFVPGVAQGDICVDFNSCVPHGLWALKLVN